MMPRTKASKAEQLGEALEGELRPTTLFGRSYDFCGFENPTKGASAVGQIML